VQFYFILAEIQSNWHERRIALRCNVTFYEVVNLYPGVLTCYAAPSTKPLLNECVIADAAIRDHSHTGKLCWHSLSCAEDCGQTGTSSYKPKPWKISKPISDRAAVEDGWVNGRLSIRDQDGRPPLDGVARYLFLPNQRTRLVLARSMISLPRPSRTAFDHERLKPLIWSTVMVGGMESFLSAHDGFNQNRPVMLECLLDHRPDLIRRFGPEPKNARSLGHLCEIGILQVCSKIEDTCGFISNSTNANELLLKTISFTGNCN